MEGCVDIVSDRKESSSRSMGDVGKLSILLLASESAEDHRLDGASGSRHECLRERGKLLLTSDDLDANAYEIRLCFSKERKRKITHKLRDMPKSRGTPLIINACSDSGAPVKVEDESKDKPDIGLPGSSSSSDSPPQDQNVDLTGDREGNGCNGCALARGNDSVRECADIARRPESKRLE